MDLFLTTSQLMATLRANVSGEEHDIDDQETALKTTKGPLHRPKYFVKFGPLTAKMGPEFSPTLRNHHLLGGGGHHVGLPLGVRTFSWSNY